MKNYITIFNFDMGEGTPRCNCFQVTSRGNSIQAAKEAAFDQLVTMCSLGVTLFTPPALRRAIELGPEALKNYVKSVHTHIVTFKVTDEDPITFGLL